MSKEKHTDEKKSLIKKILKLSGLIIIGIIGGMGGSIDQNEKKNNN